MSINTFVFERTFPIHEILTQGYFEELITTLLRWMPQRVIVADVVVILRRKTLAY